MNSVFSKVLKVKSGSRSEMINITREVNDNIPAKFTGICSLFCLHTTAGLTINENADPDVVHDILNELERLVPWNNPNFQHSEGNSAAHLKSSLMGPSLTVQVKDAKMMLGIWQGIYFCEFDGPRARQVAMQLIPANASGTES